MSTLLFGQFPATTLKDREILSVKYKLYLVAIIIGN